MLLKKMQQHAVSQLFVITTFNALIYTNAFSLQERLLLKSRLAPSPRQNYFKPCYNGKCQCKKALINCFLSDKSGAVTLEIAWAALYDEVKLTCDGAPSDMDLLLHEVPHEFVSQLTYFKLRNCLQLPAILRRPNVTYAGDIEFSTQMQVPESLFWKSKGLLTLRFTITTDNLENSLPPQLFRPLTELTELEMTIVADADEVAVPVELFVGPYALQMLSLYVYAKRTTAQNLASAHFRGLSFLKTLLLDANHLKTLNDTIFAMLPELNNLGLSWNELQDVPKNLLALQHKLVILDLSMNELAALPVGLFDNTPLLWKLLLAGNRFKVATNIIEIVRPLHYLYQLDLSKNQLTHIWGTGDNRNRTLLTRTGIRSLMEIAEFEKYIRSERAPFKKRKMNRTSINLRDNRISEFNLDWVNAAGLPCPYELDLLKNNIKHIYAATQPPSSTLECVRKLKMQFNPLHCDCKLAWIYSSNWLTRSDIWTCATPAHLKSKQLNQLQRSELCAWSPAFCPEHCKCAYEATPMLVVNCTGARLEGITQLPRPEQFTHTSTTLDIERNNFYELPANTTFGYANVTHIYAAHNRLDAILPSHMPPNLTVLDVRDNRLERLSDSFLLNYLNESETLKELYLSDNPWLCDCEAEQLLRVVKAQQARIPDISELRCVNFENAPLLNVTFTEICATPFLFASLLLPLIGTFGLAVVLLSILALFYKYKLEVKIWLFGHDWFLCCINEQELDKDKTFDAFISYAHQDKYYVHETLLPGLEQGRSPFRICTHDRNWLAGAYIPEQIVESVEQSRRTIIVLSQHFIDSDWGRMEFRTAHQCALNEGRARIIIIKFGELANLEQVDKELQAYLKMNTYLESNDSRFWNKLRYAMPHKYGEGRKSRMLEVGRRVYATNKVELNEI